MLRAKEDRMDKDVKELQEALLHCGYYPGKIDGVMGTNTKQAIKQFQQANSLDVDGLAGPRTKLTLATRLGEVPPRVTHLITAMTTGITR
jgi:peptidoglycan hydrolase-like protein with peptidoglycan-binding domain